MTVSKELQINVLGDIEVRSGGRLLELPASKKTRGLLAYLVVTARPHRRDRLCRLLWDVADDPRGALRWSLSKLRPLVAGAGQPCLLAERDSVRFDTASCSVDLEIVRDVLRVASADTAALARAAQLFRGEFLEGMDFSDFHDFQSWCIGMREEARRLQVAVLKALLQQLDGDDHASLPHARALVQCDPLDDHSRAQLVRLLARHGRLSEAAQELETGRRLMREWGIGRSEALDAVALEVRQASVVAPRSTSPAPAAAALPDTPGETTPTEPAPTDPAAPPFVGRARERQLLQGVIERAASRHLTVVLLHGEPGVGKTRLLAETRAAVHARQGTVLAGQSFEAEAHRPYGPWIDAVATLHRSVIGSTLAPQLAPLLPGAPAAGEERTRDHFFAAVVELVATCAHRAPPVLLTLDDVQWCDQASAELLHYVLRMNVHRPLCILLAARAGELPDNEAMQRVLRSVRRDGHLQEIDLAPLEPADILQLVRHVAPDADGQRVCDESAGNPLFAIEYARSVPRADDTLPPTLTALVRDRIQPLSSVAAETLHWAAVLGATVALDVLEDVLGADAGRLGESLASLERHGLLRATSTATARRGAYEFSHDLVRRSIYNDLSEPRRRLMHRRVAEAYRTRSAADPTLASELARHAARGGDQATAAAACITAARHCLRVFANGDAFVLARHAHSYAEALPDLERVKVQIDACDLRLAARPPVDPDAEAEQLKTLAERAVALGCIEHARLGFHLVSYLRWEKGDWSGARRQTLRAAEVSRAGDEREQVIAMAEAARCLVLLERDLGTAEAMALEARTRARQGGIEAIAIHDALGMLRSHRGEWDAADALFRRARTLGMREGDHRAEFQVLEHWIMLELERGRPAEAAAHCRELIAIASKLREGSDAPYAGVLEALIAQAMGADAGDRFDAALDALRTADAKRRLAYALTRAALADLQRGDPARAWRRGTEAKVAAIAIDHPTEIAMASVVLVRAAALLGDAAACARECAELQQVAPGRISASARAAVEDVLATITHPAHRAQTSSGGAP